MGRSSIGEPALYLSGCLSGVPPMSRVTVPCPNLVFHAWRRSDTPASEIALAMVASWSLWRGEAFADSGDCPPARGLDGRPRNGLMMAVRAWSKRESFDVLVEYCELRG